MHDFSTKATSHSEAYIVENGDILCDLNKTIQYLIHHKERLAILDL